MKWLKELDDLLRGAQTQPELLAKGLGHVRVKPLIVLAIVLGVVYGLFMGLFAVLSKQCYVQLLSAAMKVPVLFLLTLVVTYPSLYVFGALLNVRLGPADTLRLILAAVTVNLAVLASFGPITGFFTLSTTSYYFMKLLNVAAFTVAGVLGLGFLLRTLRRIEETRGELPKAAPAPEPAPATALAAEPAPGAPAPAPASAPFPAGSQGEPKSPARRVFEAWVIVFALVGAQMGWILRPFILDPKLEFVWFRGRQDWILVDVLRSIGKLLGGQ